MSPKDENLIISEKMAARDLHLDISILVEINVKGSTVTFPILVKDFGAKKGTIVVRHAHYMITQFRGIKTYSFLPST